MEHNILVPVMLLQQDCRCIEIGAFLVKFLCHHGLCVGRKRHYHRFTCSIVIHYRHVVGAEEIVEGLGYQRLHVLAGLGLDKP